MGTFFSEQTTAFLLKVDAVRRKALTRENIDGWTWMHGAGGNNVPNLGIRIMGVYVLPMHGLRACQRERVDAGDSRASHLNYDEKPVEHPRSSVAIVFAFSYMIGEMLR